MYKAFGLAWIPPEIREGAGEITAAAAGTLPRLVEESEILGDLHIHVDAVDRVTIDAAIQHARSKGWAYVGLVAPDGQIAELRKALGPPKGPGPRALLGVELDANAPRAGAPSGDYTIFRAVGESPPAAVPAGCPGPMLLAHLVTGPPGAVSDAATTAPWLKFARRAGLAVELTAQGAAEGIDAAQARAHHTAGGFVHLRVGVGDTSEGVLSVGLARRAGILADGVLNAMPGGEMGFVAAPVAGVVIVARAARPPEIPVVTLGDLERHSGHRWSPGPRPNRQ